MDGFSSFFRPRIGIGQQCRRFLSADAAKPCVIGGLIFEDTPGLAGESDGDVVFHAICNAISSISGVPILGGLALDLCRKDGITDSQVFLEKALQTLGNKKIEHVALSIECKRPRLQKRIEEMRGKVAKIMNLRMDQVGITAITGDGLTDFGCGDGLQCFCVLTTIES